MKIKNLAMFLVMLFFLAACAKNHEVNIAEIGKNKDKTFKIGTVKVMGRQWNFYGDNLEKKKEALKRISVKDIAEVLAKDYGLKIDTETNPTVKVARESEGQGYPGQSASSGGAGWSYSVRVNLMKSENPYYGNKEYSEPGAVGGLFVEPSLQNEDTGETIFITYSYSSDGPLWALKDHYEYDVLVKADDKVLLHHSGVVAVVENPGKHGSPDLDIAYDHLVFYADKIQVALARDIGEN